MDANHKKNTTELLSISLLSSKLNNAEAANIIIGLRDKLKKQLLYDNAKYAIGNEGDNE